MLHRSSIPATTPVGVRDLPPELAQTFYQLQAELLNTFKQANYQRVLTPTFELADVFEQGLGDTAAAQVMRFVDPQNGEVLALRTDITPQIARLMAGAMADTPLPARVSYFGRVYRLRHEQTFHRREVAQAGVELIGPADVAADVELIALCDQALSRTGIEGHTLSIGHAGSIGAILNTLSLESSSAETLRWLIGRKDTDGIETLAREEGLATDTIAALIQLTGLYGRPDAVLKGAETLRGQWPELDEACDRLRAVIDALETQSLHCNLVVDLGEVQGFGYYTGVIFHAYVPGLGAAVASGGRYDNLLGRYGKSRAAAGFAIDEEGLTEIRMRENACQQP